MRTYTPIRSETWQLDRERYKELLNFCRQYPKWLAEAKSALELSSPKMDGMPRGSDPSNPTAAAAESREPLLRKIEMVERCAMSVSDGEWYQAIIYHACMGRSYDWIKFNHPEALKSSKKSAFFQAKRRFFAMLDKERDK